MSDFRGQWAPGKDGQIMATPVENASERLRMVITDSDTLQSQIRQHLFVIQGRHMASSAERPDGKSRPASMDGPRRSYSGELQARRASHDAGLYVCNPAVIKARSSTMPACMRSALKLPPLSAAALAKAGAADSPADSSADSSRHIGGAVNATMVPRSMIEDMMTPLGSLERSISEYLKEG
ncbi:hypothetical protein COCSUDRAFT_45415 [Coccomyxa subellipsoidea C-169]|uniref:Uncharacterized protein n=1 Tax=Coccomyxa subellipsoidea (strain C-169) TaxID=574566 RepID=I0YIY5_COCSC|nr:hypothetical protein COCSUDRAFT_45415 [Coccomyxa subellipsoidea C-169]EIE18354.1 hypothetical protein COCSUDRAFT_45415 [Coccomyxa subellipsoidea C-169]|eukprot:XP_005642898.1 hypothetical protein COCSUDRAFT_45415 [Coccomyxa subellipsoidea C-169]